MRPSSASQPRTAVLLICIVKVWKPYVKGSTTIEARMAVAIQPAAMVHIDCKQRPDDSCQTSRPHPSVFRLKQSLRLLWQHLAQRGRSRSPRLDQPGPSAGLLLRDLPLRCGGPRPCTLRRKHVTFADPVAAGEVVHRVQVRASRSDQCGSVYVQRDRFREEALDTVRLMLQQSGHLSAGTRHTCLANLEPIFRPQADVSWHAPDSLQMRQLISVLNQLLDLIPTSGHGSVIPSIILNCIQSTLIRVLDTSSRRVKDEAWLLQAELKSLLRESECSAYQDMESCKEGTRHLLTRLSEAMWPLNTPLLLSSSSSNMRRFDKSSMN